MKKVLFVLVILLMMGSTLLFAAEPREGISAGVVTGLPFQIGVVGEYNFGPASAHVSMGYAGSFLIRMGGDYHFPTPFVHSDWDIDLYLSVGGHLDIFVGGGAFIALGIPVTWSWYPDSLPMKVFVKAGPELYLTGWGGVDFIGSIGAMYQF